jgi:xylulokinase
MLLIGLDVGTSGVKAVSFDPEGRILSKAYNAYQLALTSGGKRELSPLSIWGSTQKALTDMAANCPQDNICALSISSFGEAFLPIGEDGKELSSIMLFTDERGKCEFEQMTATLSGNKIAETCGLKPHIAYSASKLLYLKNKHPEIFKKTKHFLLIGDYIFYKLSGLAYTDYSLASRTMLFDVHKKQWDKNLLNLFGMEDDKLSHVVPSGTIIGEVSLPIARQLGLSPKTLLVAGGHDQPCCALGAGGMPEMPVCSMGTSECVTPILKYPLPSKEIINHGFCVEPFLSSDDYCTLAYNATSGLLVDWFFNTFAKDCFSDTSPQYKILEGRAPAHPTNLFVLPYLMGSGTPYLDSGARLAFVGMDQGTSREDIFKACLEGLCFDQRLNLELLKEVCSPKALVAVGGGSKSKLWVQIKADILQMPIMTMECNEAGALGCAVLCAVALGAHTNTEMATKAMCRIKDRCLPNPENKTCYDEMFEIYKGLHDDCAPVNQFFSVKRAQTNQ